MDIACVQQHRIVREQFQRCNRRDKERDMRCETFVIMRSSPPHQQGNGPTTAAHTRNEAYYSASNTFVIAPQKPPLSHSSTREAIGRVNRDWNSCRMLSWDLLC